MAGEQRMTCVELCWAWNAATDPAKLRTDEEHATKREEAKRLRAELDRRFKAGIDYTESDNTGRLIPSPRRVSQARKFCF